MKVNKIIFPLAIATFMVACKSVSNGDSKEIVSTSNVEEKLDASISVSYMDKKVRPQDDFFMFANGSWVKNNPVPPSESRWGSFNELDQSNMAKLTAILYDAKENGSSEKGTKLIGDYYASFIDMKQRNKAGIEPIQKYLDQVNQVKEKSELPKLIAKMHKNGISSLFRFGVSQDMKNVDVHLVSVGQGGLTLPNRDYYMEPEHAEIRKEYEQYIVDMYELTGMDSEEAQKKAAVILKIEQKLASAMLRPAEMRDPEKRYNKMPAIEGMQSFGEFNFKSFIDETHIEKFDSINIGQPAYFEFVGKLSSLINVEDWKSYLHWQTLDHFAGHLSDAFVNRSFEFYGKVLSGRTEMKPIKERAIKEITNMEFGELLGKAFVERHYSMEAQKTINELVDNLLLVFRERITDLEWMSKETKEQALLKLNSIGRKLGFPEKWTDFSTLKFNNTDYIGNIVAASQYSFNANLKKLHKEVNKYEWGMPAHMVNAYYHPLLNEIAFPAGIMQPPFFSAQYEDALNYGRIGMVIGHEFTHGFDDNGSRFDATGNFKNWWTESDRKLFEERTGLLGNTFANFCPIDGHCVNPQLTMGENIADLGGLTLAYYAYTRTAEFQSGKELYGYTPAQRFFIAYAQLWKMNFTDAELKKRIATDPHSPGMFRVNGPLMNCPEFFEAFDVKPSDPMRNEEGKVAKIW